MKLSAVLFLTLLVGCYSSRILVLVPFSGPSHWHYLSIFIREFLQRGHHVSAITGIKFKGPAHENYTEIYIDPPFDWSQLITPEQIYNAEMSAPMDSIKWMYWLGLATSEHCLASKNVQEFIQRRDDHYDLIISEQEVQESLLMFGHKFKAPIVTISTLGYADYMDYANGFITSWAFCPNLFLNYDDHMSFWQRFDNLIVSAYDRWIRSTWYVPEHNRIAHKYFASLKENGPLPSIDELEKSIALMLVNTHEAVSRPRPKMPNQISIGAAHISSNPNSLPKAMKTFIDDATEGVVYMSLGAYVQSAAMPRDKIEAILKTFSKLKQRIIWKFESDDVPELPPNVMVGKWMPQSDILAHPNVRLFITHGGMHGTNEGIYNGIPMLFIPFYGDQFRNAMKAENEGIALQIQFNDITFESFSEKVITLLKNPEFTKKAQEKSKIFKDSPMDPMELAIYYVEYVIRHKGAKHLKSGGVELTWYQHLMLDIFGLLFLLLIIAILIVKFMVKFIISLINGTKKAKKKSQ